MENKAYPIVDSKNAWLTCFNCYQDNYDFYYHATDNAPSNGKYFMTCESCGMRTFFDLIGDNNAKNTN